MSFSSRNIARKFLLTQLLAVIASELLFNLKDPFQGISTLYGGLAVLPPSVSFMIFVRCHQIHTPAKGRVAWSFAFDGTFKVLVMLALLVMTLAVLKTVLIPLIVMWVLVLATQILAPAVTNNKR